MKYLRLDKILEDVEVAESVPFETIRFNGGESHIRITGDVLNQDVMIECLAMNPFAPMMILLAKDALERLGAKNIELLLPYVPYSRQDRVCNVGEALSISVFGDLLWGEFSEVWILDPHSPVTNACIKYSHNIDRHRLLDTYLSDKEHMVLVAPDAGALKKTYEIARTYGMSVIECSKIRDVRDGTITGVSVHDDVDRMDCIVIDDICDGGRTFVELGKQLKLLGANELHLYVTHGIFSMGTYKLEDIYKTITCTTMMRTDLDKVDVQPLRKGDLCLQPI